VRFGSDLVVVSAPRARYVQLWVEGTFEHRLQLGDALSWPTRVAPHDLGSGSEHRSDPIRLQIVLIRASIEALEVRPGIKYSDRSLGVGLIIRVVLEESLKLANGIVSRGDSVTSAGVDIDKRVRDTSCIDRTLDPIVLARLGLGAGLTACASLPYPFVRVTVRQPARLACSVPRAWTTPWSFRSFQPRPRLWVRRFLTLGRRKLRLDPRHRRHGTGVTRAARGWFEKTAGTVTASTFVRDAVRPVEG